MNPAFERAHLAARAHGDAVHAAARARSALHAAIIAGHREGLTPTVLARASGYTREYIHRLIVRTALAEVERE